MVIEKINVDKIETLLEKVFETSSKLRVFQEDLENINKSLKEVNFDYLAGKISKEMYDDSRNELNGKRKLTIDRINKTVSETLAMTKSLPELIGKNKV
jgi:hypothetical protein